MLIGPHNSWKCIRKWTSMMLAAVMLGISNVMLEEDRSVNDTRAKLEQQEREGDETP